MSELYNHPDIHIIHLNGKEVIIIGTAHISKESTELVEKAISEFRPTTVALELDENRLKNLLDKNNWESLNLLQVIRNKQLSTLIFSLILSNYQKKLGAETGVLPGSELLKGYTVAKELGIDTALIDRDAKITLKRAWRKTSFLKKTFLLSNILGGFFSNEKINEEKLTEIRKTDVLTGMIDEVGEQLPSIKEVLIDERDIYLGEKIRVINSNRLLAVVGAGHVAGISNYLNQGKMVDIKEFEKIPPSSSLLTWFIWSIPLIIVASFIYIGFSKGTEILAQNLIYWVLVNGGFSALGATIGLCHPLTILTAFVAAPFTSLIPILGAGHLTTLVQAYFAPPTVKDLHNLSSDAQKFKNWWKNKGLKVFLAFLLPGFGAGIGNYLGGYEIIKSLLK